MLHFNQRNWFKMFPAGAVPGENSENETLPEPRNRKEFYLSLLAGHTPTKKKVLFSGYGEYRIKEISAGGSAMVPTIVIPGDGAVIVYTRDASYAGTTHTLELFYKTVIEDVPVKTRTEQYLKAIAAKSSQSIDEPTASPWPL